MPLKVNQIATTLNEHFIKAYLENENNYRLIMGNKNATLPNYDIEKLNLTLKDSAVVLKPNKIISFPKQQVSESKKVTNNKWIIWTALIAGLFVLLFLTKKMIKEVDKKTTNDTL